MKRLLIGEAYFDRRKSMIVNNKEMQLKELEMDRDQLLKEKLNFQ